jgi:hypothetical protein
MQTRRVSVNAEVSHGRDLGRAVKNNIVIAKQDTFKRGILISRSHRWMFISGASPVVSKVLIKVRVNRGCHEQPYLYFYNIAYI